MPLRGWVPQPSLWSDEATPARSMTKPFRFLLDACTAIWRSIRCTCDIRIQPTDKLPGSRARRSLHPQAAFSSSLLPGHGLASYEDRVSMRSVSRTLPRSLGLPRLSVDPPILTARRHRESTIQPAWMEHAQSRRTPLLYDGLVTDHCLRGLS